MERGLMIWTKGRAVLAALVALVLFEPAVKAFCLLAMKLAELIGTI